MDEKQSYIYKWHQNYTIYLFVLIIGIMLSFAMLAVSVSVKDELEKLITLILFGSFSLITLFLFLFVFLREKGRAIFFDSEKVWQKVKGITYEWRWEEMTSLDMWFSWLKTPGRFPLPFIEITTDSNYMPLVFVMDGWRHKRFLKICPNETIKQQYTNHVEGKHK